MRYILSILIVLFTTILIFGHQTEAKVIDSGELIKASGPAVYYYFDGKRYVFPNEDVFFSWFANFDDVNTVSDETLASLTIGGNVTYRPGTKLVKIVSDPKVYMVTKNNELSWLKTENAAKAVYGDGWASEVSDVSDALFLDYVISDPMDSEEPDVIGYRDLVRTMHKEYKDVLLSFIKDGQETSIDDFLHPDLMTVLDLDKYGYMASTTYSLAELEQFYKNNSADWTMQTDYLQGYDSGTARLLNFSQTRGTSFAHRSIVISSELDKDFREVLFREVVFPNGYLSYPGGVTVDFVLGDQDLRHAIISTVSAEEVMNWYKAVGATYGWQQVELTEAVVDGVEYDRMEHAGLNRSLTHTYFDGSILPEFTGLFLVGSEFNKTIE